MPALRRVSGGRTLTEVETVRHTHRHRLVKCLSRFHLSGLTTLQSQVPFGSLGRRGRPCLCFGSQTVVHYQRASHLEECRSSTHAACPSHRSPDGPFQATRSSVKGRTPPSPMAVPLGLLRTCFGSGSVSSLTLTSSRNEDDAGGKCFLIICDREARRLSI